MSARFESADVVSNETSDASSAIASRPISSPGSWTIMSSVCKIASVHYSGNGAARGSPSGKAEKRHDHAPAAPPALIKLLYTYCILMVHSQPVFCDEGAGRRGEKHDGTAGKRRRHRFFRPSQGPRLPRLHRGVGGVLLLRHAGPARAVHG